MGKPSSPIGNEQVGQQDHTGHDGDEYLGQRQLKLGKYHCLFFMG